MTEQMGQDSIASANGPQEAVFFRKPQPVLPIVLRDLDPETLGGYLIAYETGLYRYVARVWARMRKQDSHLLSVSTKRAQHVSRLDWELIPYDSTPAAIRQAQYLSDFYSGLRTYRPGGQGGAQLRGAVRHLMSAVGYGYAGCEIVWRPGEGRGGTLAADLLLIRPDYFEETGGTLQFYSDTNGPPQAIIPDKFVIHRADDCLMIAASILWLLKYTCLASWASYTDKYGMPALIGEAPAGANESSVEKLQSMLESWAANLAAVLPAGYKANVVEAKGTGTNPYESLVNWCDTAQSILWLGGDLTTQSQAGTGTLAGSAHKENEQEITEDDAGQLAETLGRQLSAPAVHFQFNEPLKVGFHFKVARAVDLIAAIGVDSALVTTFGLKISVADVRAKYGWREPDPDEEIVVPRTSPAAAPAAVPAALAAAENSAAPVEEGPAMVPAAAPTAAKARGQARPVPEFGGAKVVGMEAGEPGELVDWMRRAMAPAERES